MNEQVESAARLRKALVSCAVLVAGIVVVFPLFAWYGHEQSGTDGLLAAAVAAATCLIGGLTALLLAGLLQGQQAVQGMLLGMLVRMGIPLGTGIVLNEQGGTLAQAGVFGMILVYYLFTLALETVLSVRLVGPAWNPPKAS